MEIIIIFGILFTVICGALASRKQRSVVAWSIIGFCFGIFAVIVLAILPSKAATS